MTRLASIVQSLQLLQLLRVHLTVRLANQKGAESCCVRDGVASSPTIGRARVIWDVTMLAAAALLRTFGSDMSPVTRLIPDRVHVSPKYSTKRAPRTMEGSKYLKR